MSNDGEEYRYVKRERETPTPPGSSEMKKARVSPAAPGRAANGLPPMSHSFIGIEPIDEFIVEIADWIHGLVKSRPPGAPGVIEVEAKLGWLKYRESDDRVQFPVRNETIIASADHRFESNMPAAQHKNFNTLLNTLLDQNRQNRDSSPMKYQHIRVNDSFHRDPDGGEKIRVSRDQKSNQVVECIRKTRLGNLDIYSPKHKVDWRVSVNVEQHLDEPPPVEEADFERKKDRISYRYEEFVIDLTQVTQKDKVTHEIEVEFARPELVDSTAAVRGSERVSPAERDAFDELVRVFVNNVRLLVRNT